MFDDEPLVLLDTRNAIRPMGVVEDGGKLDLGKRIEMTGPFILTKYHSQDGYHAIHLWTDDFDPLYRRPSAIAATPVEKMPANGSTTKPFPRNAPNE